ncbi:acetoacetate decarboxylase [Spirillospora sp. NPDC049652]
MKPEELLRAPASPLPHATTRYAVPPLTDRSRGAPRLVDREYLSIVYRSDPDALRAVVPEPLEVAEPLVRFEIANLDDPDGSGPRTEACQVVAVRYGGEDGEYLHAIHLCGIDALPAGHVPPASPESAGTPHLVVEEDTLVGTLDCGTQRVATATMPYEYAPMNLGEAREQITRPTFAVKPGSGASGTGPRGLVRTEPAGITVRQAWRGPARLQLFEHALAPLAALPVLEIVSASHVLADRA